MHQEDDRQRPIDRRLSFGFPAGSSTPAQQQAAAKLNNELAATELIVNKSKAQADGMHVLDKEEYMEKAWDLDTDQDEFPSDGGGDEDGEEKDGYEDGNGDEDEDGNEDVDENGDKEVA